MTQTHPAYKFGGKVGRRGRQHAESRCYKRFLRWHHDCTKPRFEDHIYPGEIVGEWIPQPTEKHTTVRRARVGIPGKAPTTETYLEVTP